MTSSSPDLFFSTKWYSPDVREAERESPQARRETIETQKPDDLSGILREGGRPLLILFGVALLLRIVYVADFMDRHPLAEPVISDSLLYQEWAGDIAEGDWQGSPEPYHHPPLYPYFMGSVYSLTGASADIILIIQSVIGLMTLLLIYALARRFGERWAAIIITALAALYLPTVFFEAKILPATLATFLASAALFVATGHPGKKQLFLTGLLFGLLAATRPNQILTVIFVFPALAWFNSPIKEEHGRQFLRNATLLLFGFVIPVLPFFVRNVTHAGEAVLLCDTAGINLHLAHNPDAGVSFRATDPRFGDVANQPVVARTMAEASEGRPLTWAEVSSHFSRRAFDYALSHPVEELGRMAGRLGAFFSNFEYGIIYTPEAEGNLVRPTALFFVPAGLLLALAVGGSLLRRGRKIVRSPSIAPLLLFGLAQLATVLIFFQYSRFRLVALPALCALGALFLSGLVPGAHVKRAGIAVIASLIVFFASYLRPPQDATEQVANGHITLAQGYLLEGNHDSALLELEKALALQPESIRAHLFRAEVLHGANRQDEARSELENILKTHPEQPEVLATLSSLIVLEDPGRAEALARRAVQSDPSDVKGYEALGQALLFQKKFGDTVEVLTGATALPQTNGRVLGLLGAALYRSGRIPEAETALRQSLELSPDAPMPRKELIEILEKQGKEQEAGELRRNVSRD